MVFSLKNFMASLLRLAFRPVWMLFWDTVGLRLCLEIFFSGVHFSGTVAGMSTLCLGSGAPAPAHWGSAGSAPAGIPTPTRRCFVLPSGCCHCSPSSCILIAKAESSSLFSQCLSYARGSVSLRMIFRIMQSMFRQSLKLTTRMWAA